MAESSDLERAKSGERDLSGCDLTGADLSNMDLRGRDFRMAKLQGASFAGSDLSGAMMERAPLLSVNLSNSTCRDTVFQSVLRDCTFEGADLRGARFRASNIRQTSFKNANLAGTTFTIARLSDDVLFDGAELDEHTSFEGAIVSRSVAQRWPFTQYSYVGGKLTRLGSSPEPASPAVPQPEPSDEAVTGRITRALNASIGLDVLAASLVVSIEEELSRLENEKPNDPQSLARHESYVSLLQHLLSGLGVIAKELARAGQERGAARDGHLAKAASAVKQAAQAVDGWLRAKGGYDYSGRVGLLGVGTAFLTVCGAPAIVAFPAAVALLEGKNVADAVASSSRPSPKGKNDAGPKGEP